MLSGTRVGPFFLEDVLDRGGYGTVYSASDPRLRRRIALKLLHTTKGERARAGLLQEARALARIEHPNVVKVFDAGLDAGRVYLAMELVDGWNLRKWLLRPPPLKERLRVLEAAGRGLEAAHRVDIVHRDFKPANVMVARSGRVVVTDFGLAVDAIPSGGNELDPPAARVVGTPGYTSPEQLEGAPADPRSDQFAFCCVLYEAIAGHGPFRSRDRGEQHAEMQSDSWPPPIPGASRVMASILRRGLSYSADDRFPSMRALLEVMASARTRSRERSWLAAATIATIAASTVVYRADAQSTTRSLASAMVVEPWGVLAEHRRAAVLSPLRRSMREGKYELAISLAAVVARAHPGDDRLRALAEIEVARARMKLGRVELARESALQVAALATASNDETDIDRREAALAAVLAASQK